MLIRKTNTTYRVNIIYESNIARIYILLTTKVILNFIFIIIKFLVIKSLVLVVLVVVL